MTESEPGGCRSEPRVVSTFPSATELCYALGVEPVAVSDACDFPPAAGDRPAVSRATFAGESSADLHRAVGAAGESGTPYQVETSLLADLHPDLVVTQSDCGVCAVDESTVRAALPADVDVLDLSARTVEEVLWSLVRLGEATGRQARAAAVVGDVWWRLESVRRAVPAARPRVAVVEWMDPLQVAGNWIPELVTAAGGRYDLVAAGERSTAVGWERFRAAAPEVLVVAPCGYDEAETRARMAELTDRPGWESIPAVEHDRVHVLGTEAAHRWTPRLADVAETLGGMIHPGATLDAQTGDGSGVAYFAD